MCYNIVTSHSSRPRIFNTGWAIIAQLNSSAQSALIMFCPTCCERQSNRHDKRILLWTKEMYETCEKKRDWRRGVYGRREQQKLDKTEWEAIRERCMLRDSYTCQRCGKKFGTHAHLSVHHIIPRSEGGSNDLSNLITLCCKCHDLVEITGYKTVAEITVIDEEEIPDKKPCIGEIIFKEDQHHRPEWHKYVYGGCKRFK